MRNICVLFFALGISLSLSSCSSPQSIPNVNATDPETSFQANGGRVSVYRIKIGSRYYIIAEKYPSGIAICPEPELNSFVEEKEGV